MLRMLCAWALALFFFSAHAQELAAVPPLQTRVTDLANMLTPSQRDALENVLQEHEARTGSQIAVLLVNSTAPEAIEQYSIRVADAWKLGRKGIDDGVILLVAKNNPKALRRLRIETGRGVQGSLTDAQSKRIVQDVIAPHFRQNDFYGGLSAGVSAIASVIAQESLPAAQKQATQQKNGQQDSESPWVVVVLVLLLIGATALQKMFFPSRRRSGSGAFTTGLFIGGAAGGFGGGRGGGGFSRGGFSGGGGSFDGGGASGDW